MVLQVVQPFRIKRQDFVFPDEIDEAQSAEAQTVKAQKEEVEDTAYESYEEGSSDEDDGLANRFGISVPCTKGYAMVNGSCKKVKERARKPKKV
jgi:hypothetical protein